MYVCGEVAMAIGEIHVRDEDDLIALTDDVAL